MKKNKPVWILWISNVKSILKHIRVNGIDDADGDVPGSGVTGFGIIADLYIFYMYDC